MSGFPAWALTLECVDLRTSFLVRRYSFIISRSRSSIKVIRSRPRSKFQLIINTWAVCLKGSLVVWLCVYRGACRCMSAPHLISGVADRLKA